MKDQISETICVRLQKGVRQKNMRQREGMHNNSNNPAA